MEIIPGVHTIEGLGGFLFRQETRGDALDPPAEAENEPEVEDDVQAVHPELQDEDAFGAFKRDQPAGQFPGLSDGRRPLGYRGLSLFA